MTHEKNIAKLIKQISHGYRERLPAGQGKTFVADVVSVDNDTCKVHYNGAIFENVRLRSVIDADDDKFIVRPKPGSKVMIACMDGNMESLYVVKTAKLKDLEIKNGNFEIYIDLTTGKVKVRNGTVSLKSLLEEIIEEILKLKLHTPAGPSGTALPDNVTALNALKNKIQQLLN
ncbi:MAG: hypothetical protein N2747_00430 [Chitinophagaceae bacterium]|nr:hypothetical protein [Chitinophagaceae bacterium]